MGYVFTGGGRGDNGDKFEGRDFLIHTESVYFRGKVRVACRYLYSIFKFWIFKIGIHTESVYLDF